MIVQAMGYLDEGSPELWEQFEQIVIQNFGQLSQRDFDMILTGFSQKIDQGSPFLWKQFNKCVL